MSELPVPPPFNAIIERACASDAAFFERHPERKERLRKYRPGEFWPMPVATTDAWVRVARLRNGMRSREMLT